MSTVKLVRMISAAAAAAGLATYVRYRRDIAEARSRLERGSRIAATSAGDVEYAEAGTGEPLLLVHGAGGGYDQGLLIGRDLGEGFRIIAPSRFGYLRTPVPADSSPAAQAEAHAALLDSLGLEKCIVAGVSAGAPSAIEFALRFPRRTTALLLMVPRTYDPTRSIGPDKGLGSRVVLTLIEASADFLFWIAIQAARPAIVRFLGVPPELEASAPEPERERVTAIMRSILPLSQRVGGIEVDNETDLSPWPLERIAAPTLIISARDDLFGTLPGARFTAGQIRGSELEILDSGGHLMLGQGERVRRRVRRFLEDRARAALSRKAGRGSARTLEHGAGRRSPRTGKGVRRTARNR